ncbi:MAG TPA: hypothetical protein VFG81_03175 [Anaerolineales bacterium]|jgi:hypothetical protein|nr:hypothetical protein [Anaerolineales bacterium]
MKKTTLPILLLLLTTSCNGWVIQPGPFNPPTPFLPPTNTPLVLTPTPVVIGVSPTATIQIIPTSTSISFITATFASTLLPSNTPGSVQTTVPNGPALSIEILGCNTSIDVTHGLGEVTNAFVILRNTGGVDLTNITVTLRALDEGEEHPDKTLEVPSLLTGYQVSLKMTVDSTYQEATPVQLEITADGGLFQRVGAESCKDIGLFAPDPGDLGTPIPNNP